MGMRGVASQFAKASSGIWQGVADAIDPPRHESKPTPATPVAGPVTAQSTPEGTMLVPLDTWTRILEQVGNVHEAGQQLADARERAARAETENEFLRTQIADLKTTKPSTPRTTTTPEPSASNPAVPDTDETPSPTARTLRRARARASRWLSP